MKKIVLLIVSATVVIGLVAAVLWGRNYYQDRYVGSDYYAVVPQDFDLTPESLYDNQGVAQDVGKSYRLTAYDDQGESKVVEFEIYGEDSANYPQPGEYLLVSASRQIVLGQEIIPESAVPEEALRKLQEQELLGQPSEN
ncbi:MAG: DUF1093 domain-containing protein [Fastidiosipilaceae bacterium]|jgi:uncharacterized protein YxeA